MEKATTITHSECVFADLVIQHTMPRRHIVICSLPGSTVFLTLSHNRTIFAKDVTEHMCSVCSDLLYDFLLKYILRGTEREMMYIGVHVKYRHPCPILTKLHFRDRFSKNTRISNFTKNYQVGDELLHAEGQTDMSKQTVPLRNFANTPKHEYKKILVLIISIINSRNRQAKQTFH